MQRLIHCLCFQEKLPGNSKTFPGDMRESDTEKPQLIYYYLPESPERQTDGAGL